MKIYTKTGDTGETSLYRGGRVPKHSIRVSACGDVDELNSVLGWVIAAAPAMSICEILSQVQNDLFLIGADLAAPMDSVRPGDDVPRLPENAESFIESAIDEMESELPPLNQFILPGGSKTSAALHMARSVCRRAERSVAAVIASEPVNRQILIYLNRLSDLLFTMARFQNRRDRVNDVPWKA